MSRVVRILVEETGLSEALVRHIMTSAPVRYKSYEIPKRNGGTRLISQPAREVKVLQRALVVTFLKGLPVHGAATGYRKGLSTHDNAKVHAGDGQIVKLDLENFFPSIRRADWVSYCNATGCLTDQDDIALTGSLLFHRPKGGRLLRLAIGAPSSPILSNILMHEFDTRVSAAVGRDNVTYTRYADDLTFSAPRTGYLQGVVKSVAKVIREMAYPKLEINRRKTTFVTRKYHRSVTGLTLSNDGRVTVGRDRKRLIHAAVHKASQTPMKDEDLARLAGTLAYIKSVEPEFIEVLIRKYGRGHIEVIQRACAINVKRHRH